MDLRAPDPRPGVTGGIGHLIVLSGVDDEGEAVLSQSEQGSERGPGAHDRDLDRHIGAAVSAHPDTAQVAEVRALGILMAVMLEPAWIQVSSRGLKCRSLAAAALVQMHAVQARWEPIHAHPNLNSLSLLPEGDASDVVPVAISQHALHRLDGYLRWPARRQQRKHDDR